MTGKPDLLDTLDRAAAMLLEKAEIGDSMSGEKPTVATTLTEQVKAFEAVVDWAKTRKDLRPPQKEESRFDGIKREFNGAAASGRGSKPKKKAANGSYSAALGSSDDSNTPQSSTLDVVVAAFAGLGYALSARALLLLALIGAFVLSVMATTTQTLSSLYVLIAYCLFTVIPVAYLEIRRRQQ